MDTLLEQRTVIITGGGQGIGRATAQLLLKLNWRVVLAEIDADTGSAAIAALAAGESVLFCQTDVGDEASVQAMVAAAMARFGRIDGLVNNAGISHNQPLEQLTVEDWGAVIATNLTGPFLCAKHAAPHLREKSGAIVNIASTRAHMSEPDSEAYAASKGGVVALSHALALSLGPAIRVNCVSPGWIDTRGWEGPVAPAKPPPSQADHTQHPAGRVGRPEDIATAVAYLLADESGFVTGTELIVDGGMTRKMIYV